MYKNHESTFNLCLILKLIQTLENLLLKIKTSYVIESEPLHSLLFTLNLLNVEIGILNNKKEFSRQETFNEKF